MRMIVLTATLAAVLAAGAPTGGPATRPADGFRSLFNGKDLTGWDGDPKLWSVADGAITGDTGKGIRRNSFLIWKGGQVTDFELRLKYRIVGGNSGIQFRGKDLGKWAVAGYQADIDAGNRYTGILYEERGRAFLARVGEKVVIGADGKRKVVAKVGEPAKIKAAIKPEQWHEYVIVARGEHIVLRIDGMVTVDVTDADPRRRRAGVLALQLHAGKGMKIQFKDIRLKALAPPATAPASAPAPRRGGATPGTAE